jgi:hypothetical protein
MPIAGALPGERREFRSPIQFRARMARRAPMKLNITSRQKLDYALIGLFCVNAVAILFCCEDPRLREAVWAAAPALYFTSPYPEAWNKVIYDVNLGSLVSIFFYWLIVWLPEHQKRARIKRSFKAEYRSFRQDCIEFFLLMADKTFTSGLPETLLEQSAFREYFKEPVGNGRDRWGLVADALEGYYLQQVLGRMETFREEVVFVLNNVDIQTDDALAFVKRLSKAIQSVSDISPEDEKKGLLRFLWSIFSGWDFVTGYPKTDIIEDMIREL